VANNKIPKFDFSAEAQQTNQELASEIQAIGPLSADQVAKLFPTPQDQAALQKLLDIVNSSATQNTKIAQLQTNVQQLGSVALTLIKALT
jgi:NAD-dependent DNA ligase